MNGILIQAWASHKSFCRKNGGSNSGNFKVEGRGNDTHDSSTYADAQGLTAKAMQRQCKGNAKAIMPAMSMQHVSSHIALIF